MINNMISIIVPVYNTEKFLQACLDSIVAQTFTDFEAILVDDGSTDGSGRICDEYAAKDNRFIVIHKKNEGVSVARNKGVSLAKGDFVSFIDSDDYIHPQMIDILYNEINKGDFSISMCLEQNVEEYDSYGCIHTLTDYTTKIIDENELIYGITHEGKDKKHFVHCLGKLYRKAIIGDLLFDESISLSEDLLYNFELFLKGISVVRILTPLYFRTLLRGNSLSSKKSTDMIYNAGIYHKCLSYIPKTKPLFRSYVIKNICNRIVAFKEQNKDTELKQLAKTKGRELFNSIKWEMWRNNDISYREKIKYTVLFYIS